MSTSQGSCLKKRAGLYHFKRRLTPPRPPLPPPRHPSPPPRRRRPAGTLTQRRFFFFFFLPHLSNLGKPRVRKHKVFSKLVSGAFEAPPNRVSNPGDKVQSRYQPIGSRGFAYLKKKKTLGFYFYFWFCFVSWHEGILPPLHWESINASPVLLFSPLCFLCFSFLASPFYFFNCRPRRLQSSEHPKTHRGIKWNLFFFLFSTCKLDREFKEFNFFFLICISDDWKKCFRTFSFSSHHRRRNQRRFQNQFGEREIKL